MRRRAREGVDGALTPGQARIADFGRNALHTRVVGLEVGTADQVDAVGHRGEDAGHRRRVVARMPRSVSAIAFGWPGRLMISARPRITATWRDRIAVGTNAQADAPHLLAEARHLLGRRRRASPRA